MALGTLNGRAPLLSTQPDSGSPRVSRKLSASRPVAATAVRGTAVYRRLPDSIAAKTTPPCRSMPRYATYLDLSPRFCLALPEASNLRVGGSNPSRRASFPCLPHRAQRQRDLRSRGFDIGAQRRVESLPACHCSSATQQQPPHACNQGGRTGGEAARSIPPGGPLEFKQFRSKLRARIEWDWAASLLAHPALEA